MYVAHPSYLPPRALVPAAPLLPAPAPARCLRPRPPTRRAARVRPTPACTPCPPGAAALAPSPAPHSDASMCAVTLAAMRATCVSTTPCSSAALRTRKAMLHLTRAASPDPCGTRATSPKQEQVSTPAPQPRFGATTTQSCTVSRRAQSNNLHAPVACLARCCFLSVPAAGARETPRHRSPSSSLTHCMAVHVRWVRGGLGWGQRSGARGSVGGSVARQARMALTCR